jgi:hypothetical protein
MAGRKPIQNANDLWTLEQEVYPAYALLADGIIAQEIRKVHENRSFVDRAVQRVRNESPSPLVHKGWKQTSVLLQGGSRLVISTPYLREDHGVKPGPVRGKRGKKGSGIYPVLEALGIRDGVSPATRSEIALHAVQCASYREAVDMLARRGLQCEVSTLCRIANATARAGISLRDAALEAAMSIPVPKDGALAGKRVRVSLDGGKVRTRINLRGRRTRNGRHRFRTRWREPRLLVIEILNEEGTRDPLRLSLYDGLIGDADTIFSLLIGYLRLLGASHAQVVEVVCDGADWIWDRVERLVSQAQIPREKLVEALDFYHGSEYLAETLKLCPHLDDKQRAPLFQNLRHVLRHGSQGVCLVIEELRKLAGEFPGKEMATRIAYFERHAHRMRYAMLDEMKLSVGSGCVESCIRRTLNLRFKSPGSLWDEKTVGGLIHLRAYFKAGRWDELIGYVLNGNFQVPSFDVVEPKRLGLITTNTEPCLSADDYPQEQTVSI